MPNYDFKCKKCGKEKQLVCSIKEYDSLKENMLCDECGDKLIRMIGSVGTTFIVKCDGFCGKCN